MDPRSENQDYLKLSFPANPGIYAKNNLFWRNMEFPLFSTAV
jgi:hypothetical protein